MDGIKGAKSVVIERNITMRDMNPQCNAGHL